MKNGLINRIHPTESLFDGPLFIIGMPRSGTKLLRELLNQHPRISISRIETEFLPAWVEEWNTYGNLEDKDCFQKFYRNAIKLPYFIYQNEEQHLIKEKQWYEECREYSPQGIYETLIRHDLGLHKNSNIIWGDKSPSYIRHINLLKDLFPNARFIHIVRDVRDHAASIHKAWHKHPIRAAQRWNDDVQCAHDAILSLGEKGLEIRYEDLLEKPSSILKKICIFLGIEFDSQMILLNSPTENLGNTKGMIGIIKDNKANYNSLQSNQLHEIEKIAGKTMTIYNYIPIMPLTNGEDLFKQVPRWKMLVYQLLDGFWLIRSRVNQRGLIGAIRFNWRYFLSSGNRH